MTYDPSRNSVLASLLSGSAAPKPESLLEFGGLPSRFLDDVLKSLAPNGLTALGTDGAERFASPPTNALARHLWDVPMTLATTGNVFAPPGLSILTPAPPRPAARRHVFFSFHFQNDIHRVNIVRNWWRIRPEDHVPGFFDRSLWERKKRTDISALKRMIRAGLKGTSVTCVLGGEFTWARPWVRYEIAESVAQGNGLLTVDIDELRCMRTRSPCDMGPNPLDHMGVYWAQDGRAYVCELTERGWVKYERLADPVTWPPYMPDRGTTNDPHPLSLGTMRYAYRSEGGYANLTRWVREAAQAARRR